MADADIPPALRALLASSADAVLAVGTDMQIYYVNAAAAAIARLEVSNLVSMTFDAYCARLGPAGAALLEAASRGSAAVVQISVTNAGHYEAHLLPAAHLLCIFMRCVDHRHRIAGELNAAVQQLEALLNQPQIGIMHRDRSGRVLAVNARYCEILGRSAQELDQLPVAAFTHPDDHMWNLPLLDENERAGEPFHIEKRYIRPDGEVRWCALSVSYVRDADGRVASTIAFARDITDIWVARREIDASRELMQTVIDSASDLIFVKDIEGRLILANNRLREALGEPAATPDGERFGGDRGDTCLAVAAEAMATGQTSVREEVIPIAGEPRTFQTAQVPWRDGEAVLGVIGIARDITDRVNTERALRRSEERYRLVAKAIDDAIWDWDLAAGVIGWNGAAVRLFAGDPHASLEWRHGRIHADDRARVVKSLQGFVAGDSENWQCEYRVDRFDGSVAHVLDRGFLVRDAGGHAIRMIGAIMDLTERDETATRLRELQSELINVSRASAMGTMASALAHELNQPLTAASNYSRAARRSLLVAPGLDAHQAVEIIGKAVEEIMRAGEIIRRLRQMVAKGPPRVERAGLRRLLEESVELAIPSATHTEIDVDIDVANELGVSADRVQLQQALINVIRNAADAVATSPVKRLVIRAHESRDHMIIEISDTGGGIAPEIRPRLFTAFATTKANGAGVSLSICRTIIESHGGTIALDNRSPQGATCRISLPRLT